MKKRRLLVLTLAASLISANISWAGITLPNHCDAAGFQLLKTFSAEQPDKASPPNADGDIATAANALLQEPEEASFTISTVDGITAINCFETLNLKIIGASPSGTSYKLCSVDPSGTKQSVIRIYVPSGTSGASITRTVDASSAYDRKELGTYQFYIQDQQGNTIGNSLSVEVRRQPKLKIEFKRQVLTKQYSDKEPESFGTFSIFDIRVFNPITEEPLSSEILRNVQYEREPGEDIGKYAVKKLSSDEAAEIECVENEYSQFEITKRKSYVSDRSIDIHLTGAEQTLHIPDIFYLKDKEIPTKIILSELSEEAKSYFAVLPAVDGLNIKFTLKQSAAAHKLAIPFTMENNYYIYSHDETNPLILTLNAIGEKFVEPRTEEEIRSFYENHPFSTAQSDRFDVTPSVSSETAGKLSEASVTNVLNALNFIRYIAGIPADVTNNEVYETYSQTGTTLLTKVGTMTHYPEQPAGVSDEFYKTGYKGTSSSNLAWGYPNLCDALINGWMDDGDSSNISRVGHRRWCLNPNLTQTGFGHSGTYTAMYTLDDINDMDAHAYDFIPWPAQTMPLDYFAGPWMVSLDTSKYWVESADKNKIKVTLTSQKTGRTYTVDGSNTNLSGKYFNLSLGSYGHGPAVIFEPNVSFSSGDEVTVSITGLKDRYKNPESIVYTVKFFRLSSSSGGSSSGGGGGGGSSSGGGGGGGSSSGGGGGGGGASLAGGPGSSKKTGGTAILPDYVVKGNWTTAADGNWKFTDTNGTPYLNRWAAVENPYANAALGQQAFDWFLFDGSGNMMTGWYKEAEGAMYYLNPASDGTRGRMVTGWAWIPDANGVKKCYYFNPNSDGTRGKMMTNTVIEGSTLNANGEWTVNGVVQTK